MLDPPARHEETRPREAGAAKLPRRVDTFLRLAMHQRAVSLLPKRARWAIRRAVAGPPVRRHVDRCRDVTFVGVTGSLGKTTTKDLIAAALATEGPTVKTRWTSN